MRGRKEQVDSCMPAVDHELLPSRDPPDNAIKHDGVRRDVFAFIGVVASEKSAVGFVIALAPARRDGGLAQDLHEARKVTLGDRAKQDAWSSKHCHETYSLRF
jgi:hypothetical protein